MAGLARAGCTEAWLGVESGSQKILDKMDKGIRVADVPVVRERMRRAGIRACFFIQFGYPGETLEDILSTVRLARETLPDEIGRICIRRLHAFGAEWEVEAVGTEGEVRRAEGEHA